MRGSQSTREIDLVQFRADFVALGSGRTFGMIGTDGAFAGFCIGAAKPAAALFLFIGGKLDGAKCKRSTGFLVNPFRQLIQGDAAALRPFSE